MTDNLFFFDRKWRVQEKNICLIFLANFKFPLENWKCSDQRFSKYFQLWGREWFFFVCLSVINDCLKASHGKCRSKASGIKQIKHTERTIILLSSSYEVQQNCDLTMMSSIFCGRIQKILLMNSLPTLARERWITLDHDTVKKNKDKSLLSFFQSTSYCRFVCMVHCQILAPVFIVHRLLPISVAKSV